MTLQEFVPLYLAGHAVGRENSTIRTLRERLQRPLVAFGHLPLVELEHRVPELAAWRASLPPGYAFQVTAAFRQVLDAAMRWKLLTENPMRSVGPNREPRREEVAPFEVDEIDRLAIELGHWGPLVVLAAESGLRPSEWSALQWTDVSMHERLITVNHTYAYGQFKSYGKTNRSRRRVPLTARAVEALQAQPRRLHVPLVFPSRAGTFIDLNNFRRRDWKPGLEAAGMAPRRIYDLRHTFASWALDAGVSTFELARFMGTGVRMIERTYGHLVRGSEDLVREKLDARGARCRTPRSSLQSAEDQ